MSLKDVCNTEVMTILPQATVRQAAQIMRDKHVGDLVVISGNDERRPVGLLTDRDIVRFVVAHAIAPDVILVEDIMVKDLKLATVSDGIYETIAMMQKNAVRRIPVVGDKGELYGIVTADDLLTLISNELQGLSSISREQVRAEENPETAVARFRSNGTATRTNGNREARQ